MKRKPCSHPKMSSISAGYSCWWKHSKLSKDFWIETDEEFIRVHVVPRRGRLDASMRQSMSSRRARSERGAGRKCTTRAPSTTRCWRTPTMRRPVVLARPRSPSRGNDARSRAKAGVMKRRHMNRSTRKNMDMVQAAFSVLATMSVAMGSWAQEVMGDPLWDAWAVLQPQHHGPPEEQVECLDIFCWEGSHLQPMICGRCKYRRRSLKRCGNTAHAWSGCQFSHSPT